MLVLWWSGLICKDACVFSDRYMLFLPESRNSSDWYMSIWWTHELYIDAIFIFFIEFGIEQFTEMPFPSFLHPEKVINQEFFLPFRLSPLEAKDKNVKTVCFLFNMNCDPIFVLLWVRRLGRLEQRDMKTFSPEGCQQVEEWEKHMLPPKVEVNECILLNFHFFLPQKCVCEKFLLCARSDCAYVQINSCWSSYWNSHENCMMGILWSWVKIHVRGLLLFEVDIWNGNSWEDKRAKWLVFLF